MAQNVTSGTNEAVDLLALDGGGIRGISEHLILNEIMRRTQYDQQLAELPRPYDYFDLIGGTWRTDEAIQTYNTLARAIFSKENKKWEGQDGLFKATTLDEEVKELVSKRKQGERMLDPFTSTVKGKPNMEYLRRFRTYLVRAMTSATCEIWEAAPATSAALTFFKRIAISNGGGAKEKFVDEGLGCNNPVTQLLQEARGCLWE